MAMQVKDFNSVGNDPSGAESARLSLLVKRGDGHLLNDALKDVIKQLGKSGVSYKDIEDVCGVSENALKQYMFRKSRNPRFTALTVSLASAVIRFISSGRIKDSTAAFTVCDFYQRSTGTTNDAYLEQQTQFLKYIRNQMYSRNSSTSMFVQGIASPSDGDIGFFCYRKSRSRRGLVQKSSFYFFRDADDASDSCFFVERYLPARANDLKERHGIVRMTDGLVSLFAFQEGSISTTHIRCDLKKGRADGLSLTASAEEFSVDVAVFVPADKVANKTLGFIDPQIDDRLNIKELRPFHEGSQDIRMGIG